MLQDILCLASKKFVIIAPKLDVKVYVDANKSAIKADEELQVILQAAKKLNIKIILDVNKDRLMEMEKDGKLTDEEYKHIQEHVRITHNILNRIYMSQDFRIITEMACSHHEKWDGSGYYRHLKGEEITLGGRILAVADVFDAITSKRHYRDKMPIVNVIDILMKGAGSHFDKSLVDVFLSISLDKIIRGFLSESNGKLNSEDEKLLSSYDLSDIYNIGSNDNKNDKEQAIFDLFNVYYTGNFEKGE